MISLSIPVAAGDADYTAQDIVRFFTSVPPQVSARGICIGRSEQCGPVQPEQKSLSFNLMVNFKRNSAALTDHAKLNLDEFSQALKDPRLRSATFAVAGYTDASGSDRYNLRLSDRRADSVVTYLTNRGVERSRLVAKGFGETNPIVQDPYDPVNRRVETRLLAQ